MKYELIVYQLENCPNTWIGALLIILLKRVIKLPLFKPGKLIELVKKLEDEINNG